MQRILRSSSRGSEDQRSRGSEDQDQRDRGFEGVHQEDQRSRGSEEQRSRGSEEQRIKDQGSGLRWILTNYSNCDQYSILIKSLVDIVSKAICYSTDIMKLIVNATVCI